MHIRGHGKERRSNCVDDMARVEIPAVGALFNEHGPSVRRERLCDDLRLVPAIGTCCRGDGQQHVVAVRQQLRAVHGFARIEANDLLRCPSIRRDAEHTLRGCKKDLIIGGPTCAEVASPVIRAIGRSLRRHHRRPGSSSIRASRPKRTRPNVHLPRRTAFARRCLEYQESARIRRRPASEGTADSRR